MNNNQRNEIIDVGGLQFRLVDDISISDIKSIEDFKKLNKKIEKRISYYRLDSLLLTIHNFFFIRCWKKISAFHCCDDNKICYTQFQYAQRLVPNM